MTDPHLLSVEDVLDIHADQIERYGGSLGVRESELLQSAIAVPEAGFGDQYLHADLFEMAAAYLYHIVQNHPFIDGDKRTGAMADLTHDGGIVNPDEIITVSGWSWRRSMQPISLEEVRTGNGVTSRPRPTDFSEIRGSGGW